MITAAGLWTPDDPEKRAGEAVEAFGDPPMPGALATLYTAVTL